MGGLNVHADDQNSPSASRKKKWYKSPKIVIGLSVLIAIPIIGTTFATTGTVVAVDPIAFGQGQQAALKCDASVTIHPHAVYSGSAWKLDYVTITGLDISATDAVTGIGCLGKNITLGAYSGGNTIPNSEATFLVSAGENQTIVQAATWGGNTDTTATQSSSDPTDATVVISYPTPVSFTGLGGFTIQEG